MPRPPKNQAGPTAVERMKGAFWQTLEDKPYRKITISDIVKRAKVNRNAFYYHFENMDALAEASVRDLLDEGAPRIMIEGLRSHGADLQRFVADPTRQKAMQRIMLIAGKHMPIELHTMLRDAIIDVWCEAFEAKAENIDERGMLTLRYAIGGTTETLSEFASRIGSVPPSRLISESLALLVGSEIHQAAIEAVAHVLEAARSKGSVQVNRAARA